MKDERIRRRPAEWAAIPASKARCFCLANANLRAAEMTKRYLDNLVAIERVCAQQGPFRYTVHANRIAS